MIKYAFSILNILLITAASYFGVQLFYQLVSGKLMEASLNAKANMGSNTVDIADTQNLSANQRHHEFSTYQTIINRDLFKAGKGRTDKANEKIELDKLKQTQLNLKLCGTVSGSLEESYAVIEKTQNHKQALFREGDSIENALIKKILRNTVVLNVNGKDEILVIKKEKGKSVGRPAVMQEDAGEVPEPEVVEEPPPEEVPPPAETPPEESSAVNIDREKVNGALKNINQLMSQVKVRPHFKDGKPNGLMLSHIQQNSIFMDMGLQSGDIVKGVNGNAIESVDDALKFYENLKSSSSVQLQIERQGEQMSVDYQIK
jgi:general secretion pathway protein C